MPSRACVGSVVRIAIVAAYSGGSRVGFSPTSRCRWKSSFDTPFFNNDAQRRRRGFRTARFPGSSWSPEAPRVTGAPSPGRQAVAPTQKIQRFRPPSLLPHSAIGRDLPRRGSRRYRTDGPRTVPAVRAVPARDKTVPSLSKEIQVNNSETPVEIFPNPARLDDESRRRKLEKLVFGAVFTDHMGRMDWRANEGWSPPRVEAYGALTLDPAAAVLHYGQAIFEGFKAYRQPDGSICTFRPEEHAARFNRSATRLAIPSITPEVFIKLVDTLIAQDHGWVPTQEEATLYLRPSCFASEPALGVRPSREYIFTLIASPAGPYFPRGLAPVNVWLCRDYVRAVRGGTGAAKCAGNYAASLLAQAEAQKHGCDQVLWLDAIERNYIEEMGGMNVMFVLQQPKGPTLVTPSLDSGTLLPGVTRKSVLQLARDEGLPVEERLVSVDEIGRAVQEGTLLEAFACGTAAVLTPIGTLRSESETWRINNEEAGPVGQRLRKKLLDIQFGKAPDPYGWRHRIDLGLARR